MTKSDAEVRLFQLQEKQGRILSYLQMDDGAIGGSNQQDRVLYP